MTVATLVLVAIASVGFVEVTRRGERSLVDEAAGRPVFLLGLWGIAVAAALTMLASPSSVWRLTAGDLGWGPFAAIAAGWVLVVVVVGYVVDYVPAPSNEQLVGSLVGWVLVEELLFRGALFDLVAAVDDAWQANVAVGVTAVLFALGHLQYHAFRVRESLVLLAYVLPTGVLYGWVRLETTSVWPSILLHSLANVTANVMARTGDRRPPRRFTA